MMQLDFSGVLTHPGDTRARSASRVTVRDGRIESVQDLPEAAAGPRRLALPAFTNAHDHGRYFRSATVGAFEKPLETWLPFLGLLPGADPYLNAAAAFARSVRHGTANLMCHYTRVQGGMPYVQEAEAIARAAKDVGNRVGFAVSMRDRHPIGYCDNPTMLAALRPGIRDAVSARMAVQPAGVEAQMALVDEVAAMAEGGGFGEHFKVQYGPNGVQWCSPALLEAVARGSADSGRPVHMHLLETRYQRQWADVAHPQGIVRYLDSIGLLSPRLTLAHCVHARPDELALLAERGVTIAVNTSSNLYLKSGIAPVPEMLRQNCLIALGLDGTGVNEDDDPIRELRLAYQLHRGWGFDVDMDRAQLWSFAARNGPRCVTGTDNPLAGTLREGADADIVVLDWDRLDDDSLLPVDPLDLLLARGSALHVGDVYVGGRQVVASGRVLGIDEPAVRAQLIDTMRARIAADAGVPAWKQVLDDMAEDLGPFYRRSAWTGCC